MIKDNKTVGKTNKYIYSIQVAVENPVDINFIGHLLTMHHVQVLGCSFMKWTPVPNTVYITDMIDYIGTRMCSTLGAVEETASDESVEQTAGDEDD